MFLIKPKSIQANVGSVGDRCVCLPASTFVISVSRNLFVLGMIRTLLSGVEVIMSSNALLAVGGMIGIILFFSGFPLFGLIVFVLGFFSDRKFKIGHYSMVQEK